MPKRRLTLGAPKKPSPIDPDLLLPISSSPPSSPSPNTQLEATLRSSPVEEDKQPAPEAINYLIEYHFRYENDSLLQSSQAVDLRGPRPFFCRIVLDKGHVQAVEYAEQRGYALNKVYSKASLRHGGMKTKDSPVTVNLDEPRNWIHVEDILTQWADKDRISKGIKVSIDVLYARTTHGGPPRHEDLVKEAVSVAVSPVKKKAVSSHLYPTVQALTVVENNQFRYLQKHNSCHSCTGHPKRTRQREYR